MESGWGTHGRREELRRFESGRGAALIVIVVERATPGLRGQLTRWMLEVRAGVFVGSLSARVREKLWKLVCARNRHGGCLLIARAANEQGFLVDVHGDTTRKMIDIDGLWLIRKPRAS